MPRKFIVPTATRVARDVEIDSLSTEWRIQWPSDMKRWGKTYIAIERHNTGTIDLFTAARRQPVRIGQWLRLIDAVKAAIYNAKIKERN